MGLIDHSTMSSDQRPVRLRARRDLVISQSIFQGENSWVVKDPVGMKYFQLREPEHLALTMLDGSHSYRQIKNRLQDDFPEHKIRIEDVQQLVSSFHKNGLLITDASGQAAPLRQRRNKELKQKAIGLMSSIISLRFPGVDPERFLAWLYPKTKWMFSNVCTTINCIIVVCAAMLVLMNFSEFMRRMPEFQQFFGLNNLLFMGAILIVTKSIHELGHGLMCKHFGGECHEIGFMLLVLMPAMYCNTSDSWVLPNKWHRMAIGAAGMYVEVVIAAICTFVWWNTQPGALHYLCLNIMFLSGVSTILFNANPLLRYDGYYILSDFLEIPNLSQKSKMAMISKLRQWCLGMKPIPARMLPKRKQTSFALYSIASFVYRWFVILMIFWFITEVFEPYGLEILGYLVVAISLIGMVVVPLFKMTKFFLYPGRFREVKKVRTMFSAAVVLTALFAFCYVPVPHSVWVSFVVRPDNAQQVYVNQPGTLDQIKVQPGDSVVEGQTLAVLVNEDFEAEFLTLEGRLAKYQADLAAYQLSQNSVLDAARKIGETQAMITQVQRQIEVRKKQLGKLILVADRNGTVLPPPNSPAMNSDNITLASWSGTPLDAENQSAYLRRETMFCFVGDPGKMKAFLVVDQSDVKFLKPGQQVQLVLNQYRDKRIHGELKNVANDELLQLPRELSKTNGGPIAPLPQPGGSEKPLLKSYEATVALDHVTDLDLMPGMYGSAKIRVGEASLGWRLWRQIQTVVNFR